jgi:hypothetical protein
MQRILVGTLFLSILYGVAFYSVRRTVHLTFIVGDGSYAVQQLHYFSTDVVTNRRLFYIFRPLIALHGRPLHGDYDEAAATSVDEIGLYVYYIRDLESFVDQL